MACFQNLKQERTLRSYASAVSMRCGSASGTVRGSLVTTRIAAQKSKRFSTGGLYQGSSLLETRISKLPQTQVIRVPGARSSMRFWVTAQFHVPARLQLNALLRGGVCAASLPPKQRSGKLHHSC